MPLESLPDIQSTDHALTILKELASSSSLSFSSSSHSVQHQKRPQPPSTNAKNDPAPFQPFFLAVGYHKPHVPFKYPMEFRSLYPLESVSIAPNPDLPPKLPPVAFEPYTSLREREDIAALNLSFPYGPMPKPYHVSKSGNDFKIKFIFLFIHIYSTNIKTVYPPQKKKYIYFFLYSYLFNQYKNSLQK